jgi:phosphatidylserine/phosphatidylglycerophosphate/cardiolipin synthase-like enzyme
VLAGRWCAQSAVRRRNSLIYATLLSAIESAETSVHLTNVYFVQDPQLLAALEAAAGRGVDEGSWTSGGIASASTFSANAPNDLLSQGQTRSRC